MKSNTYITAGPVATQPLSTKSVKKTYDPAVRALLSTMTHEDVFCQIFMTSIREKHNLGFMTIEEARLLSGYHNDSSIVSTIKTFNNTLKLAPAKNALYSSTMDQKEKNLLASFVLDVKLKNLKYFRKYLANNNIPAKSPICRFVNSNVLDGEYSESLCDPDNLQFYFLYFSIVWNEINKKLLGSNHTFVYPDFSKPVFCKFHGFTKDDNKRETPNLDLLFETEDGAFFNLHNIYYTDYPDYVELENGLLVGKDGVNNTNNHFIKNECIILEFPSTHVKVVPSILKTTSFPFQSVTKLKFEKDRTIVFNVTIEDWNWYMKLNVSRST